MIYDYKHFLKIVSWLKLILNMKFFFTFLCLGFLTLQSCSSSADDCEPGALEFPNQQGEIDGTAFRNSLMDCRLPKVQTFEFNSYQGAQIFADQGTIFSIYPNIFYDLDGAPVDGLVTFSVLEMYNPGEIIACQLSTNGLNERNSVEPLLSESILFLSASHNGNPLRIDGEFMVFVPSENIGLEVSLFNSPACTEIDCNVLWEKLPRSNVYEEPYTDTVGNTYLGYRSFLTDLGWFSFARYNNNPEDRGILYNKADSPYSLSNSKVFLKYDSNSIAVGMYSKYDEVNEVFSENFGEIPNNTPANVIFVSKPETNFNFEASQVITSDGKITVTRDLQSGSESELIDYINNL